MPENQHRTDLHDLLATADRDQPLDRRPRSSAPPVLELADPVEATARPVSRLGIWVFGVVLAAWCAAQLFTGTPWSDLLAWLVAVACGVLAPGFALVRAVRRGGAPLIEDLAWGSAAGCLVALLGWFADRTLPWSPGPLIWGPFVVGLLLAWPVTRRRVLARPQPGWGAGSSLAMGAIMLIAVVWMTTTSLQWLPLNPGRAGVLYSPDTMYQAALVGELSHHLVPDYPFVAGEPLHYHWFLYAILAHLTTRTSVDPLDSSLRLGPASVLPAVLLLAAVVARRLSGRIAAAPVAMALLAAVDLSLANRWGWQGSSSMGGALSPIIGLWRGSPPQALGWLAGLAALGASVAWLRRGELDRAVPQALLLPFFVFCTGAKSSELPVLAAGIGLALVAALVQHRWQQAIRALLLLVAAAMVFELATVVIYRGHSYGMILAPGERFDLKSAQLFPGLSPAAQTSAVAVGTALLVGMLPLLPRLAGLLRLAARHRADPGTWITIGTCVGGFTATYLFRHPAQSEIYFLVSAYPLALVGSACGITAQFEDYAERLALTRRTFALWLAGCLALGIATAAGVAALQPAFWPLTRWAASHPLDRLAAGVSTGRQISWYLPSMAELAAVLTLFVVLIVLGLRRWQRLAVAATRPEWSFRSALAPVAVALLLGTGVYGMSQTVAGTDGGTLADHMRSAVAHAPEAGALPITQDLVNGGRWVQSHAGPNDVVAVNRYCNQTRRWQLGRSRCDAREFSPAALTQRRSYVGGWAYADRILALAWSLPPPYQKIPFWDPARLATQNQAFQRPTRAVLNTLYAAGVRWLWADLRDGPVATRTLDHLAHLRYSGPNLRIWQLPAAQPKAPLPTLAR